MEYTEYLNGPEDIAKLLSEATETDNVNLSVSDFAGILIQVAHHLSEKGDFFGYSTHEKKKMTPEEFENANVLFVCSVLGTVLENFGKSRGEVC